MSLEGSNLVEVDDLSKTYEPSPPLMRMLLRSSIRHPVRALSGVSFQVKAGETLAVVGPNGAGKSTLFRILTGLTTPSGGRAQIRGFDTSRESTRVRRLVGFSPAQERTLLLRHTCRENLMFHGRMQGIPIGDLNQRIEETLRLVGLGEAMDHVGFALSSGMRSRLQLARAWLHKPRVLILDEPTSAIDPLSAGELLEVIRRLASDEGVAVLVSSHRLEEIESLRERVLLLDRGRPVFLGDMETLRQKWQRPEIEVRFTSEAEARLARDWLNAASRGVAVKEGAGARLLIESSAVPGEILAILGDHVMGVEAVMKLRPTLLDVMKRALEDGREETPGR